MTPYRPDAPSGHIGSSVGWENLLQSLGGNHDSSMEMDSKYTQQIFHWVKTTRLPDEYCLLGNYPHCKSRCESGSILEPLQMYYPCIDHHHITCFHFTPSSKQSTLSTKPVLIWKHLIQHPCEMDVFFKDITHTLHCGHGDGGRVGCSWASLQHHSTHTTQSSSNVWM